MIYLAAEIEKFESNGEKTGWSYVFISHDIADQIKPGERKSIRVRGKIDEVAISGMSLIPMGDGDFIMALNKELRKQLRKEAGAKVELHLAFDAHFKIEMPDDLEVCLADERALLAQFLSMPKSHQNYFINWLNSAKTEPTRTKRLVMIVNAMGNKWDFGTMVRENRGRR
jgi:hypothetical protein